MAAKNYIYRNDSLNIIPLNGGWDSISTGWTRLPDTLAGGELVSAIAVCKTPANRIYYGSEKRLLHRVDNADSATPFDTLITNTTLFNANAYVSCIAVDPNDGDKVMVVFSSYRVYSLFYSADAGVTWTKVGGNLETSAAGTGAGPSLRWASIVPTPNGNVYLVGTSVGLYGTNQLNSTSTVWTNLSPNEIGYTVVDMMDYRASDGYVAIATHGGGAYSMFLTDTLATSVAEINPFAFETQVYPNPSAKDVSIRYSLLKSQHIRMSVYDRNGTLVRVLSDANEAAGDHRIIFRREELSDGIYFIRIEGEQNSSVVKKVVLL